MDSFSGEFNLKYKNKKTTGWRGPEVLQFSVSYEYYQLTTFFANIILINMRLIKKIKIKSLFRIVNTEKKVRIQHSGFPSLCSTIGLLKSEVYQQLKFKGKKSPAVSSGIYPSVSVCN